MAISFAGLSGGGGKVQKVDYIKSTQTWTAPDDVSSVEIILVGGGGGGAGYSSNAQGVHAGGGGAGGYVEQDVEVTPGATYTVTIGAGGSSRNTATTSNVSESYSNPGSPSTFGNLVEAFGGAPAFHPDVWQNNATIRNTQFGSDGGTFYVTNSSPQSASGGGGAGSPAEGTYQGGSISNLMSLVGVVANSSSQYYATSIKARQGHGAMQTNSVPSTAILPGKGKRGLAGGGGPGYGGIFYTFLDDIAVDGGGNGATGPGGSIVPSTAGKINTGGGGGGGTSFGNNPSNDKHPGSSGGSGICIIKYWSEA